MLILCLANRQRPAPAFHFMGGRQTCVIPELKAAEGGEGAAPFPNTADISEVKVSGSGGRTRRSEPSCDQPGVTVKESVFQSTGSKQPAVY